MKYSRVAILVVALALYSCNFFYAAEPETAVRVPKNFYEVLFAGSAYTFDNYKKDLQAQLDAVKDSEKNQYKAELDKAKKELEGAQEASKIKIVDQPRVEEYQRKHLQELDRTYSELLVKYKTRQYELVYEAWKPDYGGWQEHIKEVCKKRRTELLDKISNLQAQVDAYGPESLIESEKLRKNISDTKKELAEVSLACDVLIDAKTRRVYDLGLEFPQEDPSGYFSAAWEGIRGVAQDPYRSVKINELIGMFLVEEIGEIPGPAGKIFNQDIALRNISFLPRPSGPDVKYGLGFTGLLGFNTFDLRVSVYVIQNVYGSKKYSVSIELPDYYKLSDLIPGFTFLDAFSFPKSKLILSNFAYIDFVGSESVPVQKGLNLVAAVDLSGPLHLLSTLKDKSKYTRSLVFENRPVTFYGLIPKDIINVVFRITAPFHFGIDLTKVPVVPTVLSNVINKVTTDDFIFEMTPMRRPVVELKDIEVTEEAVKPEERTEPKERKETIVKKAARLSREAAQYLMSLARFNLTAEAGVRVVLSTQPDPIKFTALGILRPSFDVARSSLSIAGNMKNMLELNWLALGDATLQLDWDASLMPIAASLGIPFTGIGVKGRVDLGKPGESRASLAAAGAIKFSSKEKPDLLLEVDGKNIRFSDLLKYAAYSASRAGIIKRPVSVEKIPTMTLHRVWGHLAFTDVSIGNTFYKKGFGLQVETQLFNKKAGFRVFLDDKFQLSGFGYIPRFDVTVKGRPLFMLYGEELVPDKGPRLEFQFFNERDPLAAMFNVFGTLEIPALGLKQSVNLHWHDRDLMAGFESRFVGFSVLFGVKINLGPIKLKDIREPRKKEEVTMLSKIEEGEAARKRVEIRERLQRMHVKFGFRDDFAEFMSGIAKTALQTMRDQAFKKLQNIADRMAELQTRGIRASEAEIENMRESIKRTEQRIEQARERCAQVRWYQKAVCAKIAAQKSVLAAKKSYLNALLQPKKAAVRAVTQVGVRATRALAQAQGLRRATEAILDGAMTCLEFIRSGLTIFRIREAIGEFSSRDVSEGKLPRLVRLHIEMTPPFAQEIDGKTQKAEPIFFILEDIQFDFKHPQASVREIVGKILLAFVSMQQNKYVRAAVDIAGG